MLLFLNQFILNPSLIQIHQFLYTCLPSLNPNTSIQTDCGMIWSSKLMCRNYSFKNETVGGYIWASYTAYSFYLENFSSSLINYRFKFRVHQSPNPNLLIVGRLRVLWLVKKISPAKSTIKYEMVDPIKFSYSTPAQYKSHRSKSLPAQWPVVLHT